jgi:putative transposase
MAHKPVTGRALNVTVSKTKSGRYYASVCVEEELEVPTKPEKALGLDMGLALFLTTSEGEQVQAARFLRKAERQVKRLQRQLSRRQKGSANREKARLALARAHERVAARRLAFTHQLSTALTRSCTWLAIEDLNIRGMQANSRLAKSIGDAGWGEFFRQLHYKGAWYGCQVVQVGRFQPSSKTCSACGYHLDKLPLHVREWD